MRVRSDLHHLFVEIPKGGAREEAGPNDSESGVSDQLLLGSTQNLNAEHQFPAEWRLQPALPLGDDPPARAKPGDEIPETQLSERERLLAEHQFPREWWHPTPVKSDDLGHLFADGAEFGSKPV